MPSSITRKVLVLSASALLIGLAGAARADDTKWDKDHPRRAEVNERLEKQNARIHEEVKEGDMSKAKAARLHKEDHQIRQEERAMASQNGGHITKQEQKTLNQQETLSVARSGTEADPRAVAGERLLAGHRFTPGATARGGPAPTRSALSACG